ncbi:tyrosine-type recombinase/integrase [Billgrantia antri]|uniref:Tyrosine-type recombinase/integrase n=1 Tax=Halomonas sulfidivorans TaxID=2733488 RepID=A0ABX7WGN6_9GAMM|nr:tyrosine-type recombinase/integrase [Halomonas sulfidivorans]QTP59573.1 tyrosine-type recombinase/integrase [Halomonas sulfidivorans]
MPKNNHLRNKTATGYERAPGQSKTPVVDVELNKHFLTGLDKELRERDPVYTAYTSITYRETRDDHAQVCIRVTTTHQAAWVIHYRPRPGASERSYKIASFEDIDLKQAVKLAKEARIAISEGKHPKDAQRQKVALEGPTLAQCLEDKIRERGIRPERPKGLAQSTVKTHRKHMRILESYGLANRHMTTITSYEVRQVHDQIPKDVRKRGAKRGEGYATAAKVVNLINELYRFAEKNYETEDLPPQKIITHNPCDPLKATKTVGSDHRVRKASDRSIRQAELARFWTVLDGLKDYEPDRHNKNVASHIIGRAYLMFMLMTGMRGGALSNLKFRMYKPQEKSLYIVGDDKYLMKADNDFMLPLSDEAADIIEDMRRRHGNFSEFIFPNLTGKKGAAIGVPDWTRWVRERVQIDFTPHGLRSTYITCAESCKVPVNIYKQLVDHGNQPQDVTSGYTRSEIETMRFYAQAITDFILENAGVKRKPKEKVFTADANPFNIKDELHAEIQSLAESANKSVRDMYEQCIKLGTFAHKYPDMQAKQLLEMIAMF